MRRHIISLAQQDRNAHSLHVLLDKENVWDVVLTLSLSFTAVGFYVQRGSVGEAVLRGTVAVVGVGVCVCVGAGLEVGRVKLNGSDGTARHRHTKGPHTLPKPSSA